jgi:hypothetical protein
MSKARTLPAGQFEVNSNVIHLATGVPVNNANQSRSQPPIGGRAKGLR